MRSLALVSAFAAALAGAMNPAGAAWTPPAGVDLARPRILLRSSEIPLAQERVLREPYRTLLAAVVARAADADAVALDDDGIAAHRRKSRAAKSLAFLYAIDRTIVAGELTSLSEIGQRQAVGDRVRELLLHVFARSRLAVEPPIGGWDRDISSSEELMQYAVAYDTLLGAGYDFGDDEAAIVEKLVAFAAELYENFVRPETASNWARLHQNNHRSKTGASLAAAAIALAEYSPLPGEDPRGIREPRAWLDYGLDQVDFIIRWVLVTGDGAYAEGPFYWRFNSENILPLARAWNRLLGGRPHVTAAGLEIRDFWTDPLFARTARWMLDMTLPDGSLAPVDDGNPGRSYYFGLLPPLAAMRAAFAWRWQNAPAPFEVEGNIDLAADAIVAYDDSIVPRPPDGSPTAFYVEGGNAILRSDWSEDAVLVMVQGEHDTASQFGRDRDGRGVGPQSHEHAEPGSFLLHAYGERLLLDPGYLNFGGREAVNQPEHHNLILVDGKGPVDYLDPTFRWNRRTGRPPIDGNATLSDTVDTGFADAVRVTSRYGQPAARAARIQRRFVLLAHRTLVIADDVVGPSNPAREYTWVLHGNGGGDSGGEFEQSDHGGLWTQGAARVSSDIVFDTGSPRFAVETGVHENPGNKRRTHSVLHASTTGEAVRSLQLIHPSRTAAAVPSVVPVEAEGAIGLQLVDMAADLRVVALRRVDGGSGIVFGEVATDGTMLLVESPIAGPPRVLWAEAATFLQIGETRVVESDGVPDVLGVAFGDLIAEVLARGAVETVTLRDLPFVPTTVDGACGVTTQARDSVVAVVGARSFRVSGAAGDGQPAADPGPTRWVAPGQVLELDGSRSCDPEGTQLEYHWELISAPAGSAWNLEASRSPQPRLHVDRTGPFRLRLSVVDATIQTDGSVGSSELLVVAGELCADGIDNDLDGLFDSEDPDCDAGLRCPGDCTGEGEVTIDELIRGVEIALGQRTVAACESMDRDRNLRITVDELIGAIDAALHGCSE